MVIATVPCACACVCVCMCVRVHVCAYACPYVRALVKVMLETNSCDNGVNIQIGWE